MVQGDFWNKLKKRFKEASTAAADFTEEQAIVGKLKFDILTLKRKIDRLQGNLGSTFFKMSKLSPKPKPFEDKEVKQMITEIIDLNEQVAVKRNEITEVVDRFRSKAAEASARKSDSPSTPAEKEAEIPEKKKPAATKKKPEPEKKKPTTKSADSKTSTKKVVKKKKPSKKTDEKSGKSKSS